MRVFRDFEIKQLQDFLKQQPEAEPVVASFANANTSTFTKITDNYIIFKVSKYFLSWILICLLNVSYL